MPATLQQRIPSFKQAADSSFGCRTVLHLENQHKEISSEFLSRRNCQNRFGIEYAFLSK